MEKLIIGTREFSSRLLVGTGKYKDFQETQDAIVASGAQVVTVAIRRTNIGQNKDCLLYTSPSPRDSDQSRMPSCA